MEPQEEFVVEVLDLLRSKFINGNCTKEQTEAVSRVMQENLPIWATADEIANHFGKSRDSVHGIIRNKMFTPPKRNITLYNFKEFCKRIPTKWKNKH